MIGINTRDVVDVLSGAGVFGVIAHAVATFPTPANKYSAWLVGAIQYGVGQRVAGANTIQGKDTIAAGVPQGEGKAMTAAIKEDAQSK